VTLVAGEAINGKTNVADPPTLATAGPQKWRLINGTWVLQYVLQDGLDLGIPYNVPNYPAALSPATDGCRNITGRHSDDGTVTIYAVTSTVSTNGDQGADPNTGKGYRCSQCHGATVKHQPQQKRFLGTLRYDSVS